MHDAAKGLSKITRAPFCEILLANPVGGLARERTDALKALVIETAKARTGSARRLCMARPVTARGAGGHRRAARDRGGGRRTRRQGTHELESGFPCLDAFSARGHKRVEGPLPPCAATSAPSSIAHVKPTRRSAPPPSLSPLERGGRTPTTHRPNGRRG
jgi:hypothetical protein